MALAPIRSQIPDAAVRRWQELLAWRASRAAGRCSCGCRCDAGRPAAVLRDTAPEPMRSVPSS